MPFMWIKLVLLNLFGYWNTQEIIVFGYGNLALHKPTRQTSYYGGNRFSSKAVDGNLDTNNLNCSHTRAPQDTPNWLMVDLEDQYEITSIVVLSMDDRLRNFTVSVWQYDPGPYIKYNMVDSEYCICVKYSTIFPIQILTNSTCTKICLGRFVLVVLYYQEVLILCELQIFGNIHNGCSNHEINIKKVESKRSNSPNCPPLPYQVANVYECIHQCLQMNNCASFNYGSNLFNTDNCQIVRCFSHPAEDFTVDSAWNWHYLSH